MLHTTDVPVFDRFVTRQYSGAARTASDWMLYTSPIIPLLLLADPAIRPHGTQSMFLVGEALLVNTALNRLVKEIAHRARPFTYNPDVPLDPKLTKDARLSFYSGHTSAAASLAFSTATIWSDYHPHSGWKPVVWTGAALFPAVVGLMRVKGGKHFLSDVAVGYGVGAVIGWLVPHLHKQMVR
jgi:membrane-associated phospholipid phosphatase